jgi:hypothetical protein
MSKNEKRRCPVILKLNILWNAVNDQHHTRYQHVIIRTIYIDEMYTIYIVNIQNT